MDRNEKRNELLAQLGAEVEALRDSDRWAQWLRTASKFRRYSFGNQLLIAAQRPDATRVAGYRKWRELGRQVRRGEKAIRILAPVVRMVPDDDGSERRAVVAFTVASVFDVTQTDGPEIETIVEAHQAARLATIVREGSLFTRLATVAELCGVSVSLTSDEHPVMAGAHGWYSPVDASITVRDEGNGPATLTLLHELGHALDPDCAAGSDQCRSVGELVAQSVAYLVGQTLGIDLGEVSTVYLASWHGDSKALEVVAEKALAIASQIEDALSALPRAEGVAA